MMGRLTLLKSTTDETNEINPNNHITYHSFPTIQIPQQNICIDEEWKDNHRVIGENVVDLSEDAMHTVDNR